MWLPASIPAPFLHCLSLNLLCLFFHLSLWPSLFVSVILPLFGGGACHWDLEEIEFNYEGISLQYDWHHFLHTIEHHSHISVWGNENRPCTILSLILLNWIFHIRGALRHQPFPLTWTESPFHNIREAHNCGSIRQVELPAPEHIRYTSTEYWWTHPHSLPAAWKVESSVLLPFGFTTGSKQFIVNWSKKHLTLSTTAFISLHLSVCETYSPPPEASRFISSLLLEEKTAFCDYLCTSCIFHLEIAPKMLLCGNGSIQFRFYPPQFRPSVCFVPTSEIVNIQHISLATVARLEQHLCVIKNLTENIWQHFNCDKYIVTHYTWKTTREFTYHTTWGCLPCFCFSFEKRKYLFNREMAHTVANSEFFFC